MVVQMWRCLDCHQVRVWGNGVWDPSHYTPFLMCEDCKKYTKHVFHEHREPLDVRPYITHDPAS